MELESLFTKKLHEAGSKMPVLNPHTGEDTEIYFEVMGTDSQAWRDAVTETDKAIVEIMREGRAVTTQDYEKRDLDRILSVITGWGGITKNGKKFPFSKANCRTLLTESPSLIKQIDRYLGNNKNFMKG